MRPAVRGEGGTKLSAIKLEAGQVWNLNKSKRIIVRVSYEWDVVEFRNSFRMNRLCRSWLPDFVQNLEWNRYTLEAGNAPIHQKAGK